MTKSDRLMLYLTAVGVLIALVVALFGDNLLGWRAGPGPADNVLPAPANEKPGISTEAAVAGSAGNMSSERSSGKDPDSGSRRLQAREGEQAKQPPAPTFRETAAVARPDPPRDVTDMGNVVDPVWNLPPEENMQLFYPEGRARSLPARTELLCAVTAARSVERCRVIFEAPVGLGFGDAAMNLARVLTMKPIDENGLPVAGKTARVVIHWRPHSSR